MGFTSCKPPLPVYFDQPIGTKVQGFDTAIAGNYIPLDEVIKKGTKEFSEMYNVGYDRITPKHIQDEHNQEEQKLMTALEDMMLKDSVKQAMGEVDCDSLFHTLAAFNTLAPSAIGSDIDKKEDSRSKAGMVKIAYDRIYFITVDSAGRNMRDTLLSLGPKVLLTKYAGRYYLNFKTEFGWEITQLELWEEKFVSVRPFYFTGYNDCAKTIPELTASTQSIYPGMKPILKDKKVIGYKAVLNPNTLRDKFKKSESAILLMKIK